MDYYSLARTYSPLLSEKRLKKILAHYLDCSDRYSSAKKQDLHQAINKLLLSNYRGEELFKYFLAKEIYNEKNTIAAFEVRTNSCRVDFLTVNGESSAFEIKSERDNLVRLNSQLMEYSKVFEYNYVVVDKLHLGKIAKGIPSKCGILTFYGAKRVQVREAKKNTSLDPILQLSLLTKTERNKTFRSTDPLEIKGKLGSGKINELFKGVLRARYEKRWRFVIENKFEIMPFDLQFFFKTNVSPNLIYSV